MPEIDDELTARALRWCAEAGRPASPEQVREALSPLSWDELLAVRAVLADPPPARPLGPRALAELARGVPPAEAAARERAGAHGAAGEPLPPPPEESRRRGRATAPRTGRRAAAPVVRRARDRVPAPAPLAPAPPQLDELFESEGRAVLGRLLREHGARRAPLVAALVAGWRHGEAAPDDADLDRLLDAHGLARGFAQRERDELLHALRAAGGVRLRAAAALGLSPEAFDGALQRLGAGRDAEAIRATHREELRRRELLSDRVRLLLAEEERLADLGLLPEFEADLRARLPEHMRALRAATREPIAAALAKSLSLGPHEPERLARRLGLDVEGASRAGAGVVKPAGPARRAGPAPRAAAPRAAGGGRQPSPRGAGFGRRMGDQRGAAPRGGPARGPARGPGGRGPGARGGGGQPAGPRGPASRGGARPAGRPGARPGRGAPRKPRSR